jgi:two-component system cell cycle sensor histidine kinase/response regulator CckA
MEPLRILFAEDHEPDMELALHELRREGLRFEHRRVESKAAFQAALEEFRPDVVVTDYSMPAFTGMEALALSLGQDAERPVILFTGSINEATAVACLKAGATDYILKEHLTRLPFAVREAVEQRELRRARARAEEALDQRTEELRRFFENSTELLGIYDLEGRALRLSPSWEAVMGVPAAELEGRSAFDFFHPDDLASMRDVLARVLGGESIQGRVARVEGRDGVRSLEYDARLSGGRIYMSARDVTDRLRAEPHLREARESYEGILDSIGEAVYVQDGQGRFLHVNKAVESLYGYPRESFLGRTPEFLAAPGLNDLATLPPMIERAFAGEPQSFLFWARRADGSVFPKDVSLTAGMWHGQPVVVAVARDISERMRAQQELAESETRLRTLINAMPDIVCFKDGDGRWQEANTFDLSLFQLEGVPYRGKTDRELAPFSPFYSEAFLACEVSDEVAWRAGGMSRGEEIIPCPDGSNKVFDIIKVPTFDEQGARKGLVVVGRDVTERRRAVEDLRANEHFMRAILESSPLGISVRDRDGRLLSCNKAWQRIWAIPDTDVQDDLRRTRDRLELDERDDYSRPWWQEIQRVYREGGTLFIPEARTQGRRPGSASWVAQHFYAIPDELGAVDRIVVLTEDISERKRAEEALRLSEAHYRRFFENDLTADYISSADGMLQDCNPAYLRLFGFADREEALATPVTRLYPDPGRRRDLLERLQREERLEYVEAELRDIRGEPVHVIMNVLGVFDADGSLATMQGYLFDITRYKALQLQFHQAQKMESIGRLAGGVAHDFNNLLTVINGHVDLLRGQFRSGDPVLEQLEQVALAGDRAARLTRQLLAFSRRQVLQLEPVALNEIVADMHRMLQRLIGEDVRLETDLSRGLPGVLGDTGQLEQVVVNLAVNSRDAMPDGGDLRISTRLVDVDAAYCQTHRPMTPGRYCLLEVGDTGTGMSEEVMARVFEPFFTTKEKGRGTGLGLATVYGIVKQIGGFIWVESAPGQGTTFRIFLPALEGEAARRSAGSSAPTPLRGSERVLVVEDEEMVRRLAVRVLGSHGYEVLEAVNGRAALDLLDSLPPEGGVALVLSDVIMPGMGGRELMDHLQRRPQAPRVVFMSGYTEESIARQGIMDLGVHFIQKPFDVTHLLRVVRETLDGSAPGNS